MLTLAAQTRTFSNQLRHLKVSRPPPPPPPLSIYRNSKHVKNAKHLLEADALARKTVYNKSVCCSTIFLCFAPQVTYKCCKEFVARPAANSSTVTLHEQHRVWPPSAAQRCSLSTDKRVPVSSWRCATSETHASANANATRGFTIERDKTTTTTGVVFSLASRLASSVGDCLSSGLTGTGRGLERLMQSDSRPCLAGRRCAPCKHPHPAESEPL